MKERKLPYGAIAKTIATTAALLLIGWLVLQLWRPWVPSVTEDVTAAGEFDGYAGPLYEAKLPEESGFRSVAENGKLLLSADAATGHFQVKDKATGRVWRSYPNPSEWAAETATGTWKNHLLSPILIEYVNADNYKSASVTAGLVENGGYLEAFKPTDTGFSLTYAFPKAEFKIPVEVTLHADYVETKILDAGIVEGQLSLLNVKLYPLFGAEPSAGQDGYIFLPDGSGSLIRFDENRVMPQLTYNESVYGQDLSYYNENTGRQRITMPVYGLKSGDQAFLAIVSEGEAYANIYAAPGGSVGRSNWVTTEWQYRKRFFQSVSRNKEDGFYTYSGDKSVASSRATRYYPLPPGKSDYVGMAAVYRAYLTEEKGVRPVMSGKKDIPLVVDIVGADIEKGLLFDSYLKATTTKEATSLVNELYGLGIRNMQIHFSGWQQDGYSTHGGYFPVDKRIGGNGGMSSFIRFAKSLGFPVYLTAGYAFNTNGDDGFWWRRDGLRNLAGTVLEERKDEDRDASVYVSPGFYEKTVSSDMESYKELGADGIYFEDGIGQQVNTDYNSRYKASRSDVVDIQRRILGLTQDSLGSAAANNPNFYALDRIGLVHRLASDYSYDVFVSEPIPFAEIVLHGLRPYTLEWSNMRDEWESEFLKSIEYGAYPTYILSGDKAEDLRRSYSLWHYSLNYRHWLEQIAVEYGKANEALAEVQDRHIVGHRALADGVKETAYDGGYRIIVNYNEDDYRGGGIHVPARSFIVEKGGEGG